MPRFYFDLDYGDGMTTDDEGVELTSLEQAKRKAVSALPDIARDVLEDEEKRVLSANVRDESGRVRIRATLTLVVETSPAS
jgi:hypothetical protein